MPHIIYQVQLIDKKFTYIFLKSTAASAAVDYDLSGTDHNSIELSPYDSVMRLSPK